MRVLVVTVVHVPLDARIHARQVRSLLDAGCAVTYAAPWAATGTPLPEGLATLEVPRAVGRQRLGAVRAARRVLREHAGSHDLVLLHDPELLLVAGAAGATPVVWDVHEDVAASLVARSWLPGPLVPVLQRLVRVVERLAERRHHLLLAEHAYQHRFSRPHPVVPNVPIGRDRVLPSGTSRAVYLGRVSRARGAEQLVELGRRLRGTVTVEVLGDAEADVQQLLADAHGRGDISWAGFVPNHEALERVQGALAGLSLLRDMPNFRGSMPTKVLEYMACGVPVVTTPLPLAAEVVTAAEAGTVVPFDDVDAAATAVLALRADDERRQAVADNGRAHVLAHRSWQVEGPRFVAQLREWAARA